jgi:aspartate-alanine antiporter
MPSAGGFNVGIGGLKNPRSCLALVDLGQGRSGKAGKIRQFNFPSGGFAVSTIKWVIETAPEIFLLLSITIGTLLGRIRIHGFSIGATACTLIAAVVIGQLGEFHIPPILKAIFFSFFVFTIGYRSGPQFFASLSLRTLTQVAMALALGLTGLAIVLAFAFTQHLDPGTASGLAAGALTQSSMMGTATAALSQLGLSEDALRQQQANIAAGYAVTYILGYILTLLFVPLVAPKLMRINLKEEAAKLEATLSGGTAPRTNSLMYRKFQARAYQVSTAAGMTVKALEERIGRRAVVERIVRGGSNVEPQASTVLKADDDIVLAGPTAVIVSAKSLIGVEFEGEEIISSIEGNMLDVLVNDAKLHGLALQDFANQVGDAGRGVFLRALTRRGQEVPVTPGTPVYVGDVMTLVGSSRAVDRAANRIGQAIRSGDRTDIAYLAGGIAAGLLAGLLYVKVGTVALTLGGGGGALVAGLVCGWLRAHRPTMGAMPPAAQQTLSDLGLGAFVAAIGLANGPAAWAAIQAHGLSLLMMGIVVTLVPLIVATLFAQWVLRMNPVVICGALAGAMTVDAAISGTCEIAESQTPVLGVAVPYAVGNVVLTVLGPLIVTLTFSG